MFAEYMVAAWVLGVPSNVSRKIAIGKGYEFKDGKLVPSYKHLPMNLRLQKRG